MKEQQSTSLPIRAQASLKFTVNDEKTRICKVPETFGQMYSARTGKAYLGHRPSRKRIKRMVENIHALTARSGSCARLVSRWVTSIGLDAKLLGIHSLRRTKATLIYRRTGNLRAVQLLLGTATYCPRTSG
jgi:integrase